MNAAKRQSLSEQVAAQIKQLILEQKLRPGDRLPTEQEMADRFGVSRVSVREATKALSFLGIIHAAPRRGLTIGEFDVARVTEYLDLHFTLSGYPKRQLLRSRLVIEEGALPYVTTAIGQDGHLAETLREWIRTGTHLVGMQERIQHDLSFHLKLLEASGVGPPVVFGNLLQLFFDRFATPITAERWQQSNEEHQRLVDLLSDGNVAEARRQLITHLAGYEAQASEQVA